MVSIVAEPEKVFTRRRGDHEESATSLITLLFRRADRDISNI